MSTAVLTHEEWRRLLDGLEPASYAEVVEALADSHDLLTEEARERLDDGLEAGVLIENPDAGTYGEVHLAGDTRAGDPEARWEDLDFADLQPESIPAGVRSRAAWMAGTDIEGRKQAHAPWSDHPATEFYYSEDYDRPNPVDDAHPEWSWADPYNWTDFGNVDTWVREDPRLAHRAFILQREGKPYRWNGGADPYLLFDWDDVRDPDTGEVIPEVPALLNKLTGGDLTFAEASDSQGGLHTPLEGQLPESWPSSQAFIQLRDEPVYGHDDPPTLEIYEGPHLWWVTGDRVAGTPVRIGSVDSDGLAQMLERATTHHPNAQDALDEPEASGAMTNGDATGLRGEKSIPGGNAPPSAVPISPEELDDADVRRIATTDAGRALAHIDPDVQYHTWLRLGFALVDCFDDKADAETLYLAWSRGDLRTVNEQPAKWDATARERAQQIIKRATPAARPRDVSAGTLFKLATQAGWEAQPDDDGEATRKTPQLIRTSPPQRDAVPFDRERVWDDLQGAALQRCLDHDGPALITGDQGIGKTTNIHRGLDQRGITTGVLFPNHQKAHEHRRDPHTPDIDLHLKGAGWPKHDCCVDAVVDGASSEAPRCPQHGEFEEMPRMHVVYDLDTDHPLRRVFEWLVDWRQVRRATFDLSAQIEEATGVEPTESAWFKQFDKIEDAENIVGVFPYATLKTLREHHRIVLDDTGSLLGDVEHRLEPDALLRCATGLEAFADGQPSTETGERHAANARAFAAFARKLAAVVAEGDEDGLPALDPPELEALTIDERRGVSRQYRTGERELLDETLAQLKVVYGERALVQIREDPSEWSAGPPNLDPLFAAAIESGFDAEAARRAIAVPWILKECPWCGTETEPAEGRRLCPTCGWDERENFLTQVDGACARAQAYVDTPAIDSNTLTYHELPSPSDLPDDPLIIGSTANPRPFAGLLDVPPSEIHVEEFGPFERPDVYHYQITNGAYHKSTLAESDFAKSRMQAIIDRAHHYHRRVLYVIRKDLYESDLFDFPDDDEVEVLTYHALAGLDRPGFEAVVLIGAPHPNVKDLERTAELLTMQHEGLELGGREFSTRPDIEHAAYRKYDYDDGSGRPRSGRAGATKTYTGLVGDLFDARHAGELEQAANRIRPLLADEANPKFVYTLTNVPTNLPVDELVRLEELTDPIKTLLPVPDRAFELLEHLRDVAAGTAPEGFRAETLVERRKDGTLANKPLGYHRLARVCGMDVCLKTIYNWIDELEEVGLLVPDEYEQRAGVSYTVDVGTLQSALQVLSSNTGFKVAAVRRFREVVDAASGSLDWLGWAREALGLGGDRCAWANAGGVPPDGAR